MAIVKDPVTGTTGDIGNQDQAVFNQDVLGAQKRAERMANNTGSAQTNIVNRAPVAPSNVMDASNPNVSPVTIPSVQTPTTASSVAGSTQSLIERMVANREMEATKAAKQSEDEYKATFDQITGVQESAGDVQKEFKVNEKEATKDKLLGDLEMSQRAQLNAIRELEKNPRGLFGGALEQEKQRINREYSYEQADKALLYEIANRDYARASEQADRKIALQLEPLKMKLDFQSNFYKVNQDKLTKAQDNTLQALISKGEREYKAEEKKLETLEDTRLKTLFAIQQAPVSEEEKAIATYRVNQATTPEDIVSGAGGILGAQQQFENQLAVAKFSEMDPQVIEANGRTVLIDRKTGQIVQDYGASGSAKPPTEGQLKAATFADRLMESATVINSIGNQFSSPTSYFGELAPNFLKSSERQQFEQAQRNFINAVLRRESGAVISNEEFDNARKQYFPQPGDTGDTLKQKESNRNTVIGGMLRESGNVFQVDPLGVNEETDDPLQLNFNSVGGGTNKASQTMTPITKTIAKVYPEGSRGGQCGDFAHKLVQFPSVGDSKQAKINSVQKFGIPATQWRSQPKVGDVIITGENPTYGHVAVINAILPDGRIQLSESNYKQSERVSHDRIVSINSPKIYGAIRGKSKLA